MRRYLAIDIGASSGRHIVGWTAEGSASSPPAFETREVYRFANGVQRVNGHLIWDILHLAEEVKRGIDLALAEYDDIVSLSVDTWGIDYVLLRGDEEVLPCYSYRDSRTQSVVDEVHEKVPFSELYRRTGSQFQTFNSLYQWYWDMKEGRLEGVTDVLMIPEYLMYRLCGAKAREFTNATTTGLVNAGTLQFDREVIARTGLPDRLFPELAQPGTVIGTYRGLNVVLCATHDTASAVEGIPMPDTGHEAYVSSGTWSLLGTKTPAPLTDEGSEAANYSNEGGPGYNRYQKNITGMWLVNRLKDELAPDMSFAELDAAVRASTCDVLINANDPRLTAPESMRAAFDEAAAEAAKGPQGRAGAPVLQTVGDYFRCCYRSLAESYRIALSELEANTGKRIDELYIVGGGAKNTFINEQTALLTGKRVTALPIEATALGNLRIQLEADTQT